MDKPHVTILKSIAEFFFLAVMAIIPAMLVRADLSGGSWSGEFSRTEVMQETLLLIAALSFWLLAVKRADIRGFVVLAAGFYSVMLIREMDAFLDPIQHGFWKYPALLVAFGSIGYTLLAARDRVVQPMAAFFSTKAYFLMAIGLVTLLFFSRTIGSGKLVWDSLLGSAFTNDFKNALQEGIELYGYLLIAYASVLYARLQLKRA